MKDHCLRALLAVAETGTIRSAARALSLSQAALTKALRELELEMGVELLTRSHRGVRLTEAGRILHDRARAARHQLLIAETEIRALSGAVPEKLSIGVTPMVALSVLPDVFFQAPSVGAHVSGLARLDIRLPEALVGVLRLRHAPPSSAAMLLADLFALYLKRLPGIPPVALPSV